MQSKLYNIGEFLTPVLKASKFKETGVITPEEFIAAGDFLAFKCPSWSWEGGEESKRKNFLPPDKQFLVTRNIPCYRRVKNIEFDEDERVVDDGDWVETYTNQTNVKHEDIQDITDDTDNLKISSKPTTSSKNEEPSSNGGGDDDDEDIPDIDDFQEDNIEDSDPSAIAPSTTVNNDDNTDNILKTRTYDLYITYDKYYQTPRLWLFGYDENRKPLSVNKMYEDFSQDHAKKTVTMEPHTHLPITMASIHPCKHSNVMKKIIDNVQIAGKDLGVHLYLLIFLKFVQAVIPTIEYDMTREISM